MKNLIFKLQYLLVRFISWFACFFPLPLLMKIATPLGLMLYAFMKRPRKMAVQNLKSAFPEKNDAEIKSITKGAFIHLAEFGIEWLKMPDMIRQPEKYFIGFKNVAKMHQELRKGKGAMMYVSHIGSQEVMALISGLFITKPIHGSIYAVARPLKNPYLYEYATKIRAGMGLLSIDKSGGVRETFDRLRKDNAVVCMLIDQRVSEGSIEVNFFGRPALTTTLPVIAALRIGSPIFYGSLRRTSDFKYEMNMDGPFPIEKTGNYKDDIHLNTQKLVERIENEIRKNPSSWLWMHNRWRVQHGPKN